MPSQKIETGHEDIVHDVAMDYYGKRLATASSDTTIRIIGLSNNGCQHLAKLTGHKGPVFVSFALLFCLVQYYFEDRYELVCSSCSLCGVQYTLYVLQVFNQIVTC